MNNYENFIHLSRYSRWREADNRRETWDETVDRVRDFWLNRFKGVDTTFLSAVREVFEKVRRKEVVGSMRAFWTAGEALDSNNVAGYNCAYVIADSIDSFAETLFILASGAGVGFSVENKYVSKLGTVAQEINSSGEVHVVGDSKEGWADALKLHMEQLYQGNLLTFDYSEVRPAGARLKTMGGRASGPEPLKELIDFVTKIFKGAVGRQLTSLECHDILCAIGKAIVVGGVRRSAMISLSDLSDEEMSLAKSSYSWFSENSQRALANNSAVHDVKPTREVFDKEWATIRNSGSGERGIFSRYVSELKVAENGRRETGHEWGTNPCSEIILRPFQFCNLSEVVARRDDTVEQLAEKVVAAAILGTMQATLTDFKYLRPIWKKNTEEERLLGVSITGIQDCKLLQKPDPEMLEYLKTVAVVTNQYVAGILGIEPAAAVTAVKPSGTVSQLVSCASGIHGVFSEYYLRRVNQDNKDPLTQLLIDQGVPHEKGAQGNPSTVFIFPIKSPEGSVVASRQSAIDQLENWKVFAKHWCEHKPSTTVYVRENEWDEVGNWVYENIDLMSGVAFFPLDDSVYEQPVYQEISKREYYDWVRKSPNSIDFSLLSEYENNDNTKGAETLACVAGGCEF